MSFNLLKNGYQWACFLQVRHIQKMICGNRYLCTAQLQINFLPNIQLLHISSKNDNYEKNSWNEFTCFKQRDKWKLQNCDTSPIIHYVCLLYSSKNTIIAAPSLADVTFSHICCQKKHNFFFPVTIKSCSWQTMW